MVTKVVIKNNKRTPIRYLSELENFKNRKVFNFKTGVNVIVGENGCGKTTLLNLIKSYMLVDYIECGKGDFNCNINRLSDKFGATIDDNDKLLDGADVYADYEKNTFRLCHNGERKGEDVMKNFNTFREKITQNTSSTGECVLVAINSLFGYMFSRRANLYFDYSQFEKIYPQYFDYVKKHTVKCADEYTILMDEPDRNLSIDNISQIKSILSFHKEQTQIIAVIHNPLLICALSKNKSVNFIEMTKGYVDRVNRLVADMVRSL